VSSKLLKCISPRLNKLKPTYKSPQNPLKPGTDVSFQRYRKIVGENKEVETEN